MNGEQLFQSLRAVGAADDEMYGHMNVLTDVWTGRVLSVTVHPERDSSVRSMTIIVGSCEIEAQHGNLLAGGIPTIVGDVVDSWLDVCNKAMRGATMVATAYTASFFAEIGFNADKFLTSDVAAAMDDETRYEHLNARLNYAATKRFVNRSAAMAMDLPDEQRAKAIKNLEMSDMYLEMVEKVLHETDGQ